jgi:hypothetical protein
VVRIVWCVHLHTQCYTLYLYTQYYTLYLAGLRCVDGSERRVTISHVLELEPESELHQRTTALEEKLGVGEAFAEEVVATEHLDGGGEVAHGQLQEGLGGMEGGWREVRRGGGEGGAGRGGMERGEEGGWREVRRVVVRRAEGVRLTDECEWERVKSCCADAKEKSEG